MRKNFLIVKSFNICRQKVKCNVNLRFQRFYSKISKSRRCWRLFANNQKFDWRHSHCFAVSLTKTYSRKISKHGHKGFSWWKLIQYHSKTLKKLSESRSMFENSGFQKCYNRNAGVLVPKRYGSWFDIVETVFSDSFTENTTTNMDYGL